MLLTDEEVGRLLKNAIAQQSAILYIQPIYDTLNGDYSFAEILTRIPDGSGGILSPAMFIPYAEKSGLICDYGYMVMHKILQFIDSIQVRHFRYSFNVSPVQLSESGFYKKLIKIIESYNISPSLLTIEITESVDYELTENILKNIKELKKYGFSFALDDIGKGSSDLIKASKLPLSYIKIDRTYIERISCAPSMKILIENIVKFAAKMKMHVVAEGVENLLQKEFLENINCRFLQGFYFSRPLPSESFRLLILNRARQKYCGKLQ